MESPSGRRLYEDGVTLSQKARLTPGCLTQPDALEDVKLAGRWVMGRADDPLNYGERRQGVNQRQDHDETGVHLFD